MSSDSSDPNRSLDATRSLVPPQSSSQIDSLGEHVATMAQLFSPTDKAAGTDSTVDLNRSLDQSTQDFLSALPQADSPRTGSQRYHKLRKLGEGAFGTVWLAEDLELKRQVALKEPRPDRLQQAADIETYLAEARVLASLDHPHIVPVYDVGRTAAGSCYVVSKLIDGTDLADHVKQKSITFAAAASLVAQIAEALQHTHNRGLVHRDIKPANILIDGQNRPYVTDFGLALRDEDFGKQEGIAGTPAYMSPEQARGESHLVDGRSDIFSLGVVLYELLTGSKPFRGDNWREILQRITTVEAKPLRQLNEAIPKELERICLKALSKRATDRYPCAADLAEDLQEWLNLKSLATVRTHAQTNTPRGWGPTLSAEVGVDNLLLQLWDDLDSDLQDALALAYNQTRREKKDRISTERFFAALARLQPGRLPELLARLPQGAIPEPVADDVPTQSHILQDTPKLSNCVENALLQLQAAKPAGHKLVPEEVFVDIAKFGTGPSVVKLRTHGVTPDLIDRFVSQLGWKVVRR